MDAWFFWKEGDKAVLPPRRNRFVVPHLVGKIKDDLHRYRTPCFDLVWSDARGARTLVSDKVGSSFVKFYKRERGIHRYSLS